MKEVCEIRIAPLAVSDIRYKIFVGTGIAQSLSTFHDISKYTKIVVVTDENIAKHYEQMLLPTLPMACPILRVPVGEGAKSIEALEKLWHGFAAAGLDRKSLVINIGGGAVCDVGGFAASTYMRGISFLNIPTTLLAQTDSSIGGKVGINLAGIKNLVGSFHQPRCILCDTDLLATLPNREFKSGFAEMLKHGAIHDKEYFKFLTQINARADDEKLPEAISRSLLIKKHFVERDLFEQGERAALNFGHTIAHALEALALENNYSLLHGEAVALGMLCEAEISLKLGILAPEDLRSLCAALSHFDLPTRVPFEVSAEELLAKINLDKKFIGGTPRFSLIRGIGAVALGCVVERRVTVSAIETCLQRK